ncbi:MAG: hypothetical protein L3I99_01260 [Sulfurimonas sp.]|nr:hypothetical protein [Sulfurimonas sp.]
MQPLLSNKLTDFLDRFVSFEEAEFRDIEIINPTTMVLTFATQDKNRGYNWITVKLEFSGVSDASLVENTKLSFVDMSDGVSLKNNGTFFAFKIKNSTCQIKSSTIKFEEGQF